MKENTKELRSALKLRTVRMEEILKQAGSGKLGSAARAEFDQLAREGEVIETKLAQAKNVVGLRGKGSAETPTEPHAVLRSKHRYSDWLQANWSRESVSEGRSWPTQWDKESTGKYLKGMMSGDWHGAEAEQRASLAEGTTTTGGFLVPAPVAGMYVDLLRDALIFTQGMSHTVPWTMPGSTMSIPVAVTDVAIANLAEGVDADPPASDITFNRYLLTARPYLAEEKWSWELEEDSAVAVSDIVMGSFVKRMVRSIQSDFLYGSGASTIQGVFGTSGLLKSVEGGTVNGQAPASATGYDYVDKAIQGNRTAKLDADMIVTSPLCYQTYGRLKNTLNDAIRPSPTVQGYIDGRGGSTGKGQFYQTTAIKDTQTVGTAASDCSDMFILWSDMIYFGIKHDMSILPLRERFATQRLAGAIAWVRLDAILAHAEAQSLLQVKTS